jgi:hypothetical protein
VPGLPTPRGHGVQSDDDRPGKQGNGIEREVEMSLITAGSRQEAPRNVDQWKVMITDDGELVAWKAV